MSIRTPAETIDLSDFPDDVEYLNISTFKVTNSTLQQLLLKKL